MTKPRELKLKCRYEGDGFAGYNVVEGSTTMDDPDVVYHVREVMPDDERGDKYLAMCKYVDLKDEELAKVKTALKAAKDFLSDDSLAIRVIEDIENGVKHE